MTDYIYFYPNEKKVPIKNGATILKTATNNRIYIKHKCGGKGSCLTCKVQIEDQIGISRPNDIELRKLGAETIEKGTRLACQAKVFKSVKVEIPEDPLKRAIRKQLNQDMDN